MKKSLVFVSVYTCPGTILVSEIKLVQYLAVSCPRLDSPTNGRLLPSSCTTSKTFPGDSCRLSCRRGYRPAPWAISTLGSSRTLQCTASLSWTPQNVAEKISEVCVKTILEPFIKCPSGGEMEVKLLPGQKTADVRIPRPESNVDWWRYMLNLQLKSSK